MSYAEVFSIPHMGARTAGSAPVFIEPATVADAAEILALQRLACRIQTHLHTDLAIPALTVDFFKRKAELSRRVFLKAHDGGRIIGSIQGFQVGNSCFIGYLMVHPARRREGIGSRLVAAMEGAFSGVDRFGVCIGHKSAATRRFYEELGYVQFREEKVDLHLSLVYMEKYRLRKAGDKACA